MLEKLKGLTALNGTPVAHIEGFMSFQALPEERQLEIMTAHVVCDHETNTLSIRFGSREAPFVSPEFLVALAEALR
jgi:hypothetical protein